MQFAVEDFEAVAGLPESVFATEGFAFLNDLLFSGILFCLLPTLFLVPKLYGKIEPLLGMRPAREKTWLGGDQRQGGHRLCRRPLRWLPAPSLSATSGFSADRLGSRAGLSSGTALAIGLVVAAVLAVMLCWSCAKRQGWKETGVP